MSNGGSEGAYRLVGCGGLGMVYQDPPAREEPSEHRSWWQRMFGEGAAATRHSSPKVDVPRWTLTDYVVPSDPYLAGTVLRSGQVKLVSLIVRFSVRAGETR